MYYIPPSQDPQKENISSAFLDNVFSDEECEAIDSIGKRLTLLNADIASTSGKEVVNNKIRKNKVGWIHVSKETEFIYSKVSQSVAKLNSKYFNVNVSGIYEPLQYTLYDQTGDHYGWHLDFNPQSFVPRKLSVIVMLSDTKEFTGGELQMMTDQNPNVLENKRGRVYVFPSYFLHRVSPITHGVRKTLVAWAGGERYK
jgi:PKHD-type hydroxylase